MAFNFDMPRFGLTMEEGEITKWFKKVGETVKKGEPLVEVETDKITNEIESPEDGVILSIAYEEGDTAPVGATIAVIGAEGEIVAEQSKDENKAPQPAPEATKPVANTASGKKTIVVIGGGPGGYVTAIRAAQLGANVHIVEKNKFGGTCLNVGCVPTKALLHSADIFGMINNCADLGVKVDGVSVDWKTVMKKKEAVVKKLVSGVEGLLKANKVKIHNGLATLKDKNTVVVDGKEEINADYIVLAAGSEVSKIPFPGHDLEGVINSTGGLSIDHLPESMVIIGGGVIGIEFANLFSTFGVKIHVVELLPEILPMIDKEISGEIKKELISKGVEFHTGSKLAKVEKKGSNLEATVEKDGKEIKLEGEKVLVAIGRRAATAELGLDAVEVETERGKVVTDEHFQSTVPSIYAIGDCNGKLMLAHAASAQGVAAVEYIMEGKGEYCANTVPSCIYTNPEIACVGITEDKAKEQGIEVRVGKFNLSGNAKALIENGGKGMIKIVAGAKYGEVLGVQIYGPRATDMIAESALAIRLEATVDELITTVHAHPTVTEGVMEAALDVNSICVHWPPKK